MVFLNPTLPTAILAAHRFCMDVLPRVSRSFAVAISLLNGQKRKAVTVAYLLFRIADTLEDDPELSSSHKQELLQHFLDSMEDSSLYQKNVVTKYSLSGNKDHLDLVREGQKVLLLYSTLSLQTQSSIRHWLAEAVHGMQKFLSLYPNGVRLKTMQEYKEYCYFVAGTVGHLLTDLWSEHCLFINKKSVEELHNKSAMFGEGLQTVNILQDAIEDGKNRGVIYLPQERLRAYGSEHDRIFEPSDYLSYQKIIHELAELATQDLLVALKYVNSLPLWCYDVRLFTALPMLYAFATLREIKNSSAAPFDKSSKIKITRSEVAAITESAKYKIFNRRMLEKMVMSIQNSPYVTQRESH